MDNYLDKLKKIDDKSIKALLQVLSYQIKILGTEVIVEKYDEDGDHRKAFGALFQTDSFTRVKKSSKTSRIIINRNYLTDIYLKQSQPITVYHDKSELDVGDTIIFTQDGTTYQFKVEAKASYGLSPYILYKFDLTGIPESSNG